MIQAYIVYSLLVILLVGSSWLYSRSTFANKNILYTIVIFICSIVIGLRYNVGVDFLNYEYIYTNQYFEDVESGYALINKFLFSLGLPSPSIFILVAFLQLFLFAKGVENINQKYLPLAFFFYFTTLYFFLTLNGMRQTLAFSIFVYSIKFITNKQLLKYIITLLLASTIHKSALTLIPFYFIIRNNWILRHRIIQLILYFTTFFLSMFISDYIWGNFEVLALVSGYGDYAENMDSISEIQWGNEDGLGIYMWMLIDIWIILCFSKDRKFTMTKYDISFYNLYFIGVLLANIIAGTYLDRANLYFQNCRIVIYSIFLYNIFKSNNNIINIIIAVAFICVLIVFFYLGIHNKASMCAPFQFV